MPPARSASRPTIVAADPAPPPSTAIRPNEGFSTWLLRFRKTNMGSPRDAMVTMLQERGVADVATMHPGKLATLFQRTFWPDPV